MPFLVHNLDTLIDELVKTKPNQQQVKKLMEEVGLAYSANRIDQMQTVLQFMATNSTYKKLQKMKQKVAEA